MDIGQLLEDYEKALLAEIAAQDDLSAVLSSAYYNGKIDGKNAEMRKAQEFAETRNQQWTLERETVRRKVIEARISLEKARLYSLGGPR